jgi:hypothetical protein
VVQDCINAHAGRPREPEFNENEYVEALRRKGLVQ